jgi:hypothetical protein
MKIIIVEKKPSTSGFALRKLSSILLALLALILTALSPFPVQGELQAVEGGAEDEPYAGESLCPPDSSTLISQDCLSLGPNAVIANLSESGITYPYLPLLYRKPDPALVTMPVEIAKVNVFPPEQAPIYATLDDATTGAAPIQMMPTGQLIYISYSQWVDVNSGHYLLRKEGGWMRASPLDPSAISTYQGLLFNKVPYTSFGWIVEQTRAVSAPDWNAPQVGENLPREKVMQIFDVQEIAGGKWYMVGIDQWLERRYIRQLVPNTTPPEGVTNDRWIEINLYEQTMAVYENRQLVFATLIASGVDPYFTRPGLFQIYDKKPTETMSGAFASDRSDYYYLEDVPWTMYFDQSRALHGAYWRAFFGYQQSHGCVNLSVGDAHWLYDWAVLGDWVYVWDPSGATPTDPAFYSSGGA